MTDCTIGIDVGGTKTAAGLVMFPGGDIRAQRRFPTDTARGGQAVLDDVFRVAEGLTTEALAANFRLRGIGVGVCELVDLAGHVVSANCVAWKNLPVREQLTKLGPSVIE